MATDHDANPRSLSPALRQQALALHDVTYTTVAQAAPLQQPSTLLLTE
jgi:hypothetical protein